MTESCSMQGKFITFEGIDGAGKSTHIGFVTDFLAGRGKTVVASREPGGTPLGEKLRDVLLHETMHLETEALLMFASRREHIAQVMAHKSMGCVRRVVCPAFFCVKTRMILEVYGYQRADDQ